jgi:thioredoxin reductase
MSDQRIHDVIIVGGSYAGLSAAMALGRSLKDVLIIDSGLPCNRQTPHSHNFITQDGETPAAIAAKAREQVAAYKTVRFLNGLATAATKTDGGFAVTAQDGKVFEARKLVLATGIKDLMPPIKGFSECWGITVVHCPYCHGYELRGVKTAIMAKGDKALHLASLVSNLTDDITLLTSKSTLTPEQLDRLHAHNIPLIETEISEIEHDGGHIKNVVFADGSKIAFEAMYAALPFEQHSDIPRELGCEFTDAGHIEVDETQKTTVEGVYACGDNSSAMRSVASAVYSGNLVGAVVNRELTEERF